MIIYFLLGFFIPLASRRLIKIFPEEAGASFAYLLTPRFIKFYKGFFKKSHHNKKRYNHYGLLFLLSLFYGILSCFIVDIFIRVDIAPFWAITFVWISLVLLEIDRRVLLLPDVLTVPLLLLGFAFASFTSTLSPMDSIYGALFGYFMPALASGLAYFVKKDTIGGGDIKILSALGAWLGVYYLTFAIILSFFIFLITAIVNRKKSGPYGPAIVIASIISLYLMKIDFLQPYIEKIYY